MGTAKGQRGHAEQPGGWGHGQRAGSKKDERTKLASSKPRCAAALQEMSCWPLGPEEYPRVFLEWTQGW